MWKILVVVLLAMMLHSSQAQLSCVVNTTTTCADTQIMKMSDLNNAHAGLLNESSYTYSVCCRETVGSFVNYTCSGTHTNLVDLDSSDNAHAEMPYFYNYDTRVCISTDLYSVGVQYLNNSCQNHDTCLFSISDETNAHIGNCTAYSMKACATTGQKTPDTSSGIDGDGAMPTPTPSNITSNQSELEKGNTTVLIGSQFGKGILLSAKVTNNPCNANSTVDYEVDIENTEDATKLISLEYWITLSDGFNYTHSTEQIYARANMDLQMERKLKVASLSAWNTFNVEMKYDSNSTFFKTDFWSVKCDNGVPVKSNLITTMSVAKIGDFYLWQIIIGIGFLLAFVYGISRTKFRKLMEKIGGNRTDKL